jgi:Protein of unknown function (DUF3108)
MTPALAGSLGAIGLLAVCAASLSHAETAADARNEPAGVSLQPFNASYSVNYKGFNAGSTSLKLERDSQGVYTYESRANARGIFRVAFSEEITQTTWFVIVNGRVVPVRYRADDGSRKTDRDIEIEFDWDSERARGVAEEKRVNVAVPEGTQDAMSIQAAHLLDLARGERTMSYAMVDKDRVKEYHYRLDGTQRIHTAIGELETVIYRVERPGSKRVTRTWHAPSLAYLPVRGERLRDGKREFVMEIRSLQRQ